MAAESRRQLPLLVGLIVVLAAVSWWQFGSSTAVPRPAAAGRRPSAAVKPASSTAEGAGTLLTRGIGLERLAEDRPAPEEGGRDPFRSGASASGSGGEGESRPAQPAPLPPPPPIEPQRPIGPPPPPPITVKFIGVVKRGDVGKVAVLSDGKNVYYGREGEIVDGRWRIVTIGEESLQIEYADGRGRQTVRLTG
jgi:hypothetical protein